MLLTAIACALFSAGAPSITLKVPATVQSGQTLSVQWSVKDAPKGSSLGFFIESVDARSSQPMMLETRPVSGAKSGSFDWDGAVGQATDGGAQLTRVKLAPGQYVIKVLLVPVSKVDLVATYIVHDDKPPLLAEGKSKPFSVVQ